MKNSPKRKEASWRNLPYYQLCHWMFTLPTIFILTEKIH